MGVRRILQVRERPLILDDAIQEMGNFPLEWVMGDVGAVGQDTGDG